MTCFPLTYSEHDNQVFALKFDPPMSSTFLTYVNTTDQTELQVNMCTLCPAAHPLLLYFSSEFTLMAFSYHFLNIREGGI